jgi:hypothetical protein
MLLYNITVGIDRDIEQIWLKWIRENHIPDVMATGLFESYKMFKVLHDEDEAMVSYSIQYFAKTIQHVTQYLEIFAPKLVAEHRRKFVDKHVVFQTLLEEVA